MFTWREARLAGYSAWQIRARVADGRWRTVLGPVLATAGVPATQWTRDRAAYLAAGEFAVLSGPSAARLHGMDVRAPFACVTVPRGRHLEFEGVRVLREGVPPGDLALIEDMLVTERARTVVDCLRLLPDGEATALLDRALQKRWISFEQLAGRAAAHRGRWGAGRLRSLVAAASSGAHSGLERAVHRHLRAAGIAGWRANYEVMDDRGLIGIVDIAFPALRLAVELDGRAHHSAADRFQRDRTRQNRLVNAGWTVLRFTWQDVANDPAAVIATIAAAIGRVSGGIA